MDNLKFTWYSEKNRANIEKHGIDFNDVKDIFNQPRVEKIDNRYDYGEVRIVTYEYLQGIPLVVVYTERDDNTFHLISARIATSKEERELISTLNTNWVKQRQYDRKNKRKYKKDYKQA